MFSIYFHFHFEWIAPDKVLLPNKNVFFFYFSIKCMLWYSLESNIDAICPLAIPNQVSLISTHVPGLVKIPWFSNITSKITWYSYIFWGTLSQSKDIVVSLLKGNWAKNKQIYWTTVLHFFLFWLQVSGLAVACDMLNLSFDSGNWWSHLTINP